MQSASASVTSGNLSLVALKAFGDLVIAINCIEPRLPAAGNHIEILLGQHLRPLFDALEPQITSRIVNHPEPGLPSLFTVKKDGMAMAVRSALGLKRAVASAGLPDDQILLFDHLGPRERIVTSGWRQIAIPKKDNIYLSYDDFFDRQWPASATPAIAGCRNGGPLRIFPGSRVPAKNLPASLVRNVIDIADARGVRTELMLLEGERPDLEAAGLPFTLVPRTFTAMVAAVRGAGKVVSADSMPAHIAEHTGRNMFVLSPVNNRFWLPRTAYLQRWDALFDEGVASPRLLAFIDAD